MKFTPQQVKFTPQRVKSLHSIDGVNYSLDIFFLESSIERLSAVADPEGVQQARAPFKF